MGINQILGIPSERSFLETGLSEVLSVYKFPEKPFGKLFLDRFHNQSEEWRSAFMHFDLEDYIYPF